MGVSLEPLSDQPGQHKENLSLKKRKKKKEQQVFGLFKICT
jgi:hypothetical protein